MNLFGYELRETCCACPEQYDVYRNGVKVAYLRLRGGYFYASVPDCGGEKVYFAYPDGDGCFGDNERLYYLSEAVQAIHQHYSKLAKS